MTFPGHNDHQMLHNAALCPSQVGFSAVIFVLLGSEDGFSTEWKHDAAGQLRAPALYNALFSTIAFLLGAITSIVSGFLGASVCSPCPLVDG